MAKEKPISDKMYELDLEIAYWDNYISQLIEFIRHEELDDKQVSEIQSEISRVEFYKKELCINMVEYLKLTDKIK